jgi:hypothetical protein
MVLEHFQSLADDLIEDWGSDIIFTPKTHTDTYGGYTGTETNDTDDRIYTKAVPASLFSRVYNMRPFGNVENGTSYIIVKSEVIFESGVDYDVLWNSGTYTFDSKQELGHFENIDLGNAFQVVTLKKQV